MKLEKLQKEYSALEEESNIIYEEVQNLEDKEEELSSVIENEKGTIHHIHNTIESLQDTLYELEQMLDIHENEFENISEQCKDKRKLYEEIDNQLIEKKIILDKLLNEEFCKRALKVSEKNSYRAYLFNTSNTIPIITEYCHSSKEWHQLNNENDLYYKNLYPVTEKQYNRLTELQEESVFLLSEDLIMQVINAVEYKQDGWNPAHYRRGMCGIGYSGMAVGTEGYHEKSYTKWKDMMQRCHDKEVHKKYKPEYADKCVCEEWQNYANFKLWYDEHHVFGNRIDLDKDILKPGNKEYSPETCVLIEHYINTIFERHVSDNIYENEDGKYFVGSNRKKVYETYDQVFEFACNKKKERIEKVAEKNLGRIPKCAYDAMLRYDVEALIRRDVIAA